MSIGYGSVATMEIFDDKNENINDIWLWLQATIIILSDKRNRVMEPVGGRCQYTAIFSLN